MSGEAGDGALEIRARALDSGRTLRLELLRAGRALTRADVLERWCTDAAFVERWNEALANAPFEAFFWETPPLVTDRRALPFECVLVDAPTLARMRPDPESFRRPLRRRPGDTTSIACFENLGGDALLLAPRPLPEVEARVYPHLAAFCRGAPAEQRRDLWRAVGERVRRRVSDRPLWVSTSGLGVAWLHVRLDRYPKYYQHHPYRSPDAAGD